MLVVDKTRFPRDKPCAELASPGVEDVLRRIGAWPAVQAQRPRRLRGMQLIGPGGDRVTGLYPQGRALVLPRPQFDAALLTTARAYGAVVWEGVRVLDVVWAGGQVAGVVAAPEPAQPVTARLVVGADGLHSTVARQVGAMRPGRWPQRTALVTHLDDVAGLGRSAEVGEMHVRPGAYVGLAPLPSGRVNVGLVLSTDAVRRRAGSVEQLFWQELARFPRLDGRLQGAQRTKQLMGLGPLSRRVRTAAGPGYLLVGDAAGFFDPFTGEGIIRALRGAELAAAAADAILRAPAGIPDPAAGYQRARREAFIWKDILCLVIQAFVTCPPLLSYALPRLRERPTLRPTLFGALADTHPARRAVAPSYLAALMRP